MEKSSTKQAMKELTMILMYLSRFSDERIFSEETANYAWKGYNFNILNELDDDEYIYQGEQPSRNKKIFLTEAGKVYAKNLLKKYDIDDWK